MRNWLVMITLTLFATLAVAQEQLPDQAPLDDDDSDTMAERFQAPPMDRQEMENLYLESPALVENREEQGLSSLRDEDRYHESDLLFQEQLRRSQDTITVQQPEESLTPPPLPNIPNIPDAVRQL